MIGILHINEIIMCMDGIVHSTYSKYIQYAAYSTVLVGVHCALHCAIMVATTKKKVDIFPAFPIITRPVRTV